MPAQIGAADIPRGSSTKAVDALEDSTSGAAGRYEERLLSGPSAPPRTLSGGPPLGGNRPALNGDILHACIVHLRRESIS